MICIMFFVRSRSTSSVKQHSQWQRFEHRMRQVAEAANDNLRVGNNDACDCSCAEGCVVLTTSQAPTQACSCTSCVPGRSGCTIHIFLDAVPFLSYLQSCGGSEVKCEDCAGGHDALMQCVERRQRSRSRSRRSSIRKSTKRGYASPEFNSTQGSRDSTGIPVLILDVSPLEHTYLDDRTLKNNQIKDN